MTAPGPATASTSLPLANEHPWSAGDERWERAASPEHLLRLLLADSAVVEILRACDVDGAGLADALDRHLAANAVPEGGGSLRRLSAFFWIGDDSGQAPLPASAVSRIVERARIQARASNGRQVGPADIFVALLREPQTCVAAKLVFQAGATQYDALRFVSHGLAKDEIDPLLAERGERDDLPGDLVMLNDNYTPMEFVVDVLQRFFGKSNEDAARIMLDIHAAGSAVVGTYPDRKSALAKAEQVTTFVRGHHLPLRCVVAHSKSEREGAHAELLT